MPERGTFALDQRNRHARRTRGTPSARRNDSGRYSSGVPAANALEPPAGRTKMTRRTGSLRASVALLASLAACGTEHAPSGETPAEPAAQREPPPSAPHDAGAPRTKTVLRIHYPVGERKLEVLGDIAPLRLDVPFPLTSASADTFEYVDEAPPGPISVTPLLDGKPARGPRYVVRPGSTLDIYPHFEREHGRVTLFRAKLHSEKLGNDRGVRVYVPPSYEENTTARYPVIYMHDGQVVFDANLTPVDGVAKNIQGNWAAEKRLDEGIDAGAFPEAIVVAIDIVLKIDPLNPLGVMDIRNSELTPTNDPDQSEVKNSGRGPLYLAMLLDELKPIVDRELRTKPERESTFVLGASLGGLISSWAGLEHGDRFAGTGSLSGSSFWHREVVVKKATGATPGAPHASRVYIDVGEREQGTSDPAGNIMMVVGYEHLAAAHRASGYVDGSTLVAALEPDGKHNGDSWSKRLPKALAFLLGPGR